MVAARVPLLRLAIVALAIGLGWVDMVVQDGGPLGSVGVISYNPNINGLING